MERKEDQKKTNGEKWIEMQKKQGKMKVLFPYAILAFQIFWQKPFHRSQIGAISSKEKRSPLYFVQSRSEAKLYKQLST